MKNKKLGLIIANLNNELINDYKNLNQYGIEIGQVVLNSDDTVYVEAFENVIDFKYVKTEEEALAQIKYINDLQSKNIAEINLNKIDLNYLYELIKNKYEDVETVFFNGNNEYQPFAGALLDIRIDSNEDIVFKLIDQEDNVLDIDYNDLKLCDFAKIEMAIDR